MVDLWLTNLKKHILQNKEDKKYAMTIETAQRFSVIFTQNCSLLFNSNFFLTESFDIAFQQNTQRPFLIANLFISLFIGTVSGFGSVYGLVQCFSLNVISGLSSALQRVVQEGWIFTNLFSLITS